MDTTPPTDVELKDVELKIVDEHHVHDTAQLEAAHEAIVELEPELEPPTPEQVAAARDFAAASYLSMPKIVMPLEGADLQVMRDPETNAVKVQLGPVMVSFVFEIDTEGANGLADALRSSPIQVAKISDLDKLMEDGIRRKRSRGRGH